MCRPTSAIWRTFRFVRLPVWTVQDDLIVLTVGDFIAFNNGEEAKITWGDILSLSRDNLGITKLEIGDIINL